MNLTIPYQLENFIGGNFTAPLSGMFLNNVNPATGEVYGQIPNSNDKDVEQAVAAAQKAFPAWSVTPAEKRFTILNSIADLIDTHLNELAEAETIDNGKPLWLSKVMDMPRASSNFRFFATGLMHFATDSHAMEDTAINYTLRQPIGVVGCISPWNLPLYLFTWKIAPALAAGNCVIAKPSEVTPVTAFLLAKICKEAGLPDGVLNIVHGDGPNCGEAIVKHPGIKAISFTGSTRAGAQIASVAAPMFKKLSLELGGKNPAIIFSDCNWELMLKETIRSSFTNQGQICLCTSRLLIERTIYDKFKTAFAEKVQQLTVGDPMNDNNRQGAIVSKVHFEKIMRCIETAKQEGGTILCGGTAITLTGKNANGYFITPTVIENLGPATQTNQEEIFGPVVTLQPFDTVEEALQLANATQYGLATTIWTQDINKAHTISAQVQSGIIWVNCWLVRDLRTPFGGVKNSGVGREGGWEALRFFTEPKNICIALA
ncbi:MAG: aldehyde dehydrogenase [Bacteroidetes bacterium]|nr:aldehyde dehydrogenase [Bacteroidota bacterium]